jgi:hypothetical protein
MLSHKLTWPSQCVDVTGCNLQTKNWACYCSYSCVMSPRHFFSCLLSLGVCDITYGSVAALRNCQARTLKSRHARASGQNPMQFVAKYANICTPPRWLVQCLPIYICRLVRQCRIFGYTMHACMHVFILFLGSSYPSKSKLQHEKNSRIQAYHAPIAIFFIRFITY